MKNLFILKTISLLIFVSNTTIISYAQETENTEVSREAKLVLSFSEEDIVKTITATATNNQGLPIEGLDLYFFVKRTFSLLPIGDDFNTTEEDGTVSVEFPSDLPGDAEGKIIFVVKILESDDYNDFEVTAVKNWGIPTHIDEAQHKRSLWAAASNAPITLILGVNIMIVAVWYIIFYIIFKLYKISRIKPLKS